jgi:proline dehydrogenase
MVDFNALLARLPGRPTLPDREGLVAALDRVPVAREAATPFVAGESVADAVAAVAETRAAGMDACLEYLPQPGAEASARLVHLQLITALGDADLAEACDLLVDPGALGVGRSEDAAVVTELRALSEAAAAVGMTVTLAPLPAELLDRGLAVRAAVVEAQPQFGLTLAAQLQRSEGDCLDLAAAGARVRLVRTGPPPSPGDSAFHKGHDIDLSYVRCLRILIEGGARTTVATHDPRLLEIAGAIASRSEAAGDATSFQFRRGVLPERAAELVAAGSPVSTLVPFGPGWARYVSTRLALKPSSVGQALRAASGRGEAS